jgi:hypothetical protein
MRQPYPPRFLARLTASTGFSVLLPLPVAGAAPASMYVLPSVIPCKSLVCALSFSLAGAGLWVLPVSTPLLTCCHVLIATVTDVGLLHKKPPGAGSCFQPELEALPALTAQTNVVRSL